MPELRWNPLINTWTMVATNRQNRPHLPTNYNPFAPGQGKLPASYDVLAYENDFPTLCLAPNEIKEEASSFFKNKAAYGKCEVILYTDNPAKELYHLSDEHVLKLVELWTERYRELSKNKRIKYIFEFENRGEEVGVTIHHPHGQLYAYSWLPQKIETELTNCKNYFKQNGSNLFADMNAAEKQYKKRIIAENKSFLCYIPYFTDYPFGVFIVSKNLKQNFTEFTLAEKKDLAEMLKKLVAAFDKIYDRKFPYMMCIHQSPVNTPKFKDCASYYSFHIEFYPPLRAKDKIKWYAGSEMGAGAAANPLDVDVCAALLKSKFLQ
ncbi:MAG: galactose-1-phosphate uridylyltransferase [Bacteroidetes bacterium 37-13]|nr:MAG: galactose-1-phosphate uridylyltransferase [Bacteroidetes bacterium 37-13]